MASYSHATESDTTDVGQDAIRPLSATKATPDQDDSLGPLEDNGCTNGPSPKHLRFDRRSTGISTNGGVSKSWRRKAVLSFDGGGTRGYFQLRVIERLMERVGAIESTDLHPSHKSSFQTTSKSYPNGFNVNGQAVRRGSIDPGAPYPFIRSGTDMSEQSVLSGSSSKPPSRKGTWFSASTHDRWKEKLEAYDVTEDFLPCHYFDFMFGASTGSASAIQLGRLRGSASQCRGSFPDMARRIFGRRRISFRGLWRNRYNNSGLRGSIQAIVDQNIPPSSGPKFGVFKSPKDLCRTAVLALQVDEASDEPYIFRSYDLFADHEDGPIGRVLNPGDACSYKISEVALAATAAQRYFKPVEIDGHTYEDAAAGFNNPAEEAMYEVLSKEGWHTGREEDTPYPIAVLISVGTGEKPRVIERLRRKVPVRRLRKLFERVKRRLTDVDRVHNRLERAAAEQEDLDYYRFQGPVEVGSVKMDEWKKDTQRFLDEQFETWVRDPEIDQMFSDAARSLVSLRRARLEDDPARWRRWACCTTYVCRKCGTKLKQLHKLRSHILQEHPNLVSSLDDMLRQSERPPDFEGGPY